MKKIILWLIGIMIVSILIAGILFVLSPKNKPIIDYNTVPINEKEIFDAKDIDMIDVKTVSTDIDFIPTDESEIKVHFYGRTSKADEEHQYELNTNRNGDKLSIEIKHNSTFYIGFNFVETKLDVYIPKTYSESINLTTVSGDINIIDLNLNEFKFKSVSGDFEAANLISKDTDLYTTSGQINIEDFEGNLKAETVSGDYDLKYKTFENNIKIKSISGDVEIKLPEDSEFDFKAKTVSGDIQLPYPMSVRSKGNVEVSVGESDNLIYVDTVSGDIEIEK